MTPYFYRGTFTSDLRFHALQRADRFSETMRRSVEAFDGNLIRCFFLAAIGDPIGFVEFPSDEKARAWSYFYASQEGVISSEIQKLVAADDLKTIWKLIDQRCEEATGHRNEGSS